MRRILKYLRPYTAVIALIIVLKFTCALSELLIPWILAHMIDDVAPTHDVRAVVLWGLLMAACAAFSMVSNGHANRRASAVGRDTTRALRHDLFQKIEHLSSRQMDEVTVPSLISRMTSDSYTINNSVCRLLRIGVRAPILLLGGVAMMLMQDVRLSLVLICMLPLLTVGVGFITSRGIPRYRRVQKAGDTMLQTVRDDVVGIRVIRALSKGEFERRHFHRDNCAVSSEQIRADTIMSSINPLMNLLLNGGLTAMIVAGAFFVHRGVSRPGTIIAFLSYFAQILNSMMAINRIFVMLTRTTASAQRIDEVFNLPPEAPEGDPCPRPDADHVVFDDVSFSYRGRQNDISHISFSVPRGQTMGIIGATGSGKTTLIQLLQRFYPVSEGKISLDGENINAMPDEVLHRKFGVAFQSDAFFAGTVLDNIDLGRGLPMDQIRRAARCAQAAEFIDAFPDGYGHPVLSKGANLSGGQRQRLLIARALAGNPEILILDDSSSALDYRTDAALRTSLQEMYPGITTLLIAQRVSSVRGARQILVLDGGTAAGLGSHDELMKTCPLYAQISRIQTGDDLPGGDELALE